ncbi:hypothetical protein CISG_09547 [Coccidioides immitis RMSCC 3703]|uniref:Uncharacterized protein n=1 Tax=Coccidioides immitis RMSCC 3703 TaxID=454286 RepID=A0A0J8QJ24_COCIT|nr:hypothetical protein CISG_09547 [Coccidioides immitis RMSCC 3703]
MSTTRSQPENHPKDRRWEIKTRAVGGIDKLNRRNCTPPSFRRKDLSFYIQGRMDVWMCFCSAADSALDIPRPNAWSGAAAIRRGVNGSSHSSSVTRLQPWSGEEGEEVEHPVPSLSHLNFEAPRLAVWATSVSRSRDWTWRLLPTTHLTCAGGTTRKRERSENKITPESGRSPILRSRWWPDGAPFPQDPIRSTQRRTEELHLGGMS